MELEGSDKSKTRLKPGSAIEFGRDHGFSSTDRTVSRRHVTLRMEGHKDKPTVYFEVVGRNPMWVYSHNTGKVEIFRRFDRGEMENGDMFCFSAKNPIWFTLKRADFGEENEPSEKSELGLEIKSVESIETSTHEAKLIEELDTESVDISTIDPVEEFGLVVLGHEFDGFPIREPRSWNWYIEEPGEESEDDDVEEKRGKKNRRRKKKKGVENDDDDEWTGEEGEDEKESQPLTKLRKAGKPTYATRSKDRHRTSKDDRRKDGDLSGRKKSAQPEEEDAEDEGTLGGFIVDDVPEEEREMEVDEEEEEEEFIEDEDEE